MRNRGLLILSVAVIAVGLLLLFGALFDIDTEVLCLPTILILVGVFLLLRPWLAGRGIELDMTIFGPVRRSGAWQVHDDEIWLLVGDVILDLSEAEIPPGETVIRVFAFVAETRLIVPEGIGVSLSSMAFLTTTRFLGKKRDYFFTSARPASDDYGTAERRIRLEPTGFVADVKVMRPAAS